MKNIASNFLNPKNIAVITKHEGFKWIERKHYYNQELNINCK